MSKQPNNGDTTSILPGGEVAAKKEPLPTPTQVAATKANTPTQPSMGSSRVPDSSQKVSNAAPKMTTLPLCSILEAHQVLTSDKCTIQVKKTDVAQPPQLCAAHDTNLFTVKNNQIHYINVQALSKDPSNERVLQFSSAFTFIIQGILLNHDGSKMCIYGNDHIGVADLSHDLTEIYGIHSGQFVVLQSKKLQSDLQLVDFDLACPKHVSYVPYTIFFLDIFGEIYTAQLFVPPNTLVGAEQILTLANQSIDTLDTHFYSTDTAILKEHKKRLAFFVQNIMTTTKPALNDLNSLKKWTQTLPQYPITPPYLQTNLEFFHGPLAVSNDSPTSGAALCLKVLGTTPVILVKVHESREVDVMVLSEIAHRQSKRDYIYSLVNHFRTKLNEPPTSANIEFSANNDSICVITPAEVLKLGVPGLNKMAKLLTGDDDSFGDIEPATSTQLYRALDYDGSDPKETELVGSTMLDFVNNSQIVLSMVQKQDMRRALALVIAKQRQMHPVKFSVHSEIETPIESQFKNPPPQLKINVSDLPSLRQVSSALRDFARDSVSHHVSFAEESMKTMEQEKENMTIALQKQQSFLVTISKEIGSAQQEGHRLDQKLSILQEYQSGLNELFENVMEAFHQLSHNLTPTEKYIFETDFVEKMMRVTEYKKQLDTLESKLQVASSNKRQSKKVNKSMSMEERVSELLDQLEKLELDSKSLSETVGETTKQISQH